MIEKYQTYRDSDGRLFIVINVFYNVTWIDGKMHAYPTTLNLLQIKDRILRENISVKDFMDWELKGLLTKCTIN